MSLSLDELKAKAAEIESAEQDAPATLDGDPDPMAELKPEEPVEEPKEEPKEGEEPAEGDVEEPKEEPVELELDEDGNPIQQEFAFDPNIKVMDNDVQVPDFLAKSVTNEEEAKALTELIQKSYGLDTVKEKRDHFKTKATELETKFNESSKELGTLNENLEFLDSLIQKNDLHTFQQFTKIQDEQILKRAAEIIQYRELTPAQKAEYDNNIQSRQRLYSQEMELKDLRQNQSSDEIERTHTELDSVISSDDYQQVAAQFDARLGDGAFQREVIQRAMLVEQQSNGKTIWSPQQAVEETVRVLGLTQSQSPEPTQQPQEPTIEAQQAPVAPEQKVVITKKPTITKVSGGAKSPARPIVKSIDDIRRLAETMPHG